MRRIATTGLCLLLMGSLLAPAAGADPSGSVTVTEPPAGRGEAFVPGVRPLPDGYVEEEYLVSGEATLYNYANNPPQGPTDIVAIANDVPYQTRIIVRRPAEAKAFNGTVVIEWWNSTAGFDTAPVWDPSAEYFGDEGIAYVGVTNSTTSIEFLAEGCSLFGVFPPPVAPGTRRFRSQRTAWRLR